MDGQIVALIDSAVAKLPVPEGADFLLYEGYKRELGSSFPDWAEQEYLRKALAKRFGI